MLEGQDAALVLRLVCCSDIGNRFGRIEDIWLEGYLNRLILGSHDWCEVPQISGSTLEEGRSHDSSDWLYFSRGRSDVHRGCVLNRLREASNVDKMSRHNKAMGQDRISRKEWVMGIPSREHAKQPVRKGLGGVPSIPILEI